MSHAPLDKALKDLLDFFEQVGHFSAAFRGERFKALITGETALHLTDQTNTRLSRVFRHRGAIISDHLLRPIDIVVNTDLDTLHKLVSRLAHPLDPQWETGPEANARELEVRWSRHLSSLGVHSIESGHDYVGCKVEELGQVRFWPSMARRTQASCLRLLVDKHGNIIDETKTILPELLRGEFTSSGDPRDYYSELRLAAQYALVRKGKAFPLAPIDTQELMRLLGIAPKRGFEILYSTGQYQRLFRHAQDYHAIKPNIVKSPSQNLAQMYKKHTPGSIRQDLSDIGFSEKFIERVIDVTQKLQNEHRDLYSRQPADNIMIPDNTHSVIADLVMLGVQRGELTSQAAIGSFIAFLESKANEGVLLLDLDYSNQQMLDVVYLRFLSDFKVAAGSRRVAKSYFKRKLR